MQYERIRNSPLFHSTMRLVNRVASRFNWKASAEMLYWRVKKMEEGELHGQHFEFFFTTHFGLSQGDFTGKRMLDLGCGPRGSLEWATQAKERVGLDPLAKRYLKLGADQHQMSYVEGVAEAIPFPDQHFEVVSSLNSLDHVDGLEQAIGEIKRVLKPGGVFLLIADIHQVPTLTEPSAFGWDILARFQPEFQVIRESHYEGHQLYKSIRKGIPFDHQNPKQRYGIITALLQKR
ncbi:MAG: class I SAM-dependent methyltransferase [Bacteroidota bacterium]